MRGFSRQGSLNDIQNNLADSPLLSGILLQDVPLVAGFNEIEHGLGRPVRGAIPVLIEDGNVTLSHEGQRGQSLEMQSRVLKIRSSNSTIVSLWIF